jgi:TetR/AcrR family transcriptional regulator, acrAB operon repressor
MVRRTRDEAAETRTSIIDAAERVFAKRGVSHTSLEDIARDAGVTRGAIYWHFKNKSEVFSAMVDRITLPMEDMVARSGEDDADDPLTLLREAAVFTLKRTASDPQCQRVFDVVTHKCEYLDDMKSVKHRLSELKCGCVSRAEKAIRNAKGRGLLPKSLDARLAAVGLDALIFGLISNWLANREYLNLARDGEALIGRYIESLKLEPMRVGRSRKPGTREPQARVVKPSNGRAPAKRRA